MPHSSDPSPVIWIDAALEGYLSAQFKPPKDGYDFGFSFYVTVWALLEKPVHNFQVGLPSTWIQPDNLDFKHLLCPKGTEYRDTADKQQADKEKDPTNPNLPHDASDQFEFCFRDVFQNIEGGAGFWGTVKFPTTAPKYRILGIPDCYSARIGSPGWPFGATTVLPDKDMGLAQLSNRFLLPPDGIPFDAKADAKRLGVAWMALPLTDYDGYFCLQSKTSIAAHEYLQRGLIGAVHTIFENSVPNNSQLWKLVPGPEKGYFYLETKNNTTPADFDGETLWKLVPTKAPPDPGLDKVSDPEEYYFLESRRDKNKCLGGRFVVNSVARSPADGTQLWKLVPQAINGNPTGVEIDPSKVEVATGDSSWTLFLNSANFKGPVAFFPPKTWSRKSKRNPVAVGRGLDARKAFMRSPAMEFNTVPGMQARHMLTSYVCIPKISFPVEKTGGKDVTPLMQDMMLYSREAIYAPVMSWFANGPAASGAFGDKGAIANKFDTPDPVDFKAPFVGGTPLRGISDLVEVINLSDSKSCSWGLWWKAPPKSEFVKGQLPQYFVGGNAVPNSMVPIKDLELPEFRAPATGPAYELPTPLGDDNKAWKDPADKDSFSVVLGDKTTVEYRWYKFIDQPALQNLNLTDEQKDRLQKRVELLHKKWGINNRFMKDPSKGKLISVDPKLIVTPPKNREVGYVPIVIGQISLR
jgi:hypothetical protein